MHIILESDKAEQEARKYASDARWNGSNTDRGTVSQTNARGAANARGVFALDISGTVMDNTAYESQGKTVEEVMQESGLSRRTIEDAIRMSGDKIESLAGSTVSG